MTTKTFAFSMIAVSVATYFITVTTLDKDVVDCPDLASYSDELSEIEESAAVEYITQFENNYSIGREKSIGGIISGATLDTLFSNEKTNAVSYYFGIDTSDSYAKGKFFIVLSGAFAEYDSDGNLIVKRTSAQLYLNNNWCPPNCDKLLN
jgi:hypothetical protein